MFRLLPIRSLVLVVCCLLLPASAYADPVVITNALNDNDTAFTWTFTFRGLPPLGTNLVTFSAQYTNLPIEWGNAIGDPEMRLSLQDLDGDGIFRVVVLGNHVDGPHNDPGDRDIDPGHDFLLDFDNINGLGAQNMSLAFTVVPHLHFQGDHSDAVQLFGRRVGNDFFFSVEGVHRNTPVPEPATMLLLGTGLAGVAMKMRKRLKRRV